MPVVEHEVHQHGVRSADVHRYGCHNRPDHFQPLVLMEQRIAADGWVYAVERRYPHRMSHDCRYDRSLSDRFCAGCRHAGNGERYIAEREAEGAK